MLTPWKWSTTEWSLRAVGYWIGWCRAERETIVLVLGIEENRRREGECDLKKIKVVVVEFKEARFECLVQGFRICRLNDNIVSLCHFLHPTHSPYILLLLLLSHSFFSYFK